MTSPPKPKEALPERYLRFGEFELDLEEEALRLGDKKLNISRRMFQVLHLLIQRRGEIVTKHEFFEKVWDGNFVEENNLTVTITGLRKLLDDNAKQARFIENIPRRGYRFVAELIPEPGHGNRNGVGVGNVAESDIPSGWQRTNFPVILSIGVVLILVAIGVGFGGLFRTTPSEHRLNSIAVLPFENRSTGNEYLADGLTDGVINDLLRQSGLRVIDRNSAYQYRNGSPDRATIGRGLNVQTVLTGAIEQYGDALIVNAELTDLTTGSVLWSQQFRRSPTDLFSTQREISQAIIATLVNDPSATNKSRLANRPTDDPVAYDLYLRGRYLWNKRTDVDIQKSLQLFRSAIDRDPTFAKAYVGLADAYTLVGADGLGMTSEEKNALTRGAIRKALEIDPDIGEAYASLAINKCYFDWDWSGAERDYRRALELNPNDATAHHWYAEFLSMQGRFEESRREYEIAISLDPLSMPIKLDSAFSYFYSRDFDTAIALLNREKELDPDYQRIYDFLYFVYRERGMYDEAVRVRERRDVIAIREGLPPENREWSKQYIELLRKAAGSGDRLEFWRTELQYGPDDPSFRIAANAKIGDRDAAFAALEKAFQQRATAMVWIKVNPEYDNLRSDPRFEELLRRVGL